jgi:hypothetical protein
VGPWLSVEHVLVGIVHQSVSDEHLLRSLETGLKLATCSLVLTTRQSHLHIPDPRSITRIAVELEEDSLACESHHLSITQILQALLVLHRRLRSFFQ